MQFKLPLAAIVATLAAPVAGQQTSPDGSIPIYDITPQVAPTPTVTATPAASPRATSSPRATPTPAPRAAPPVVRATPRPVATATPLAVTTPAPRATPASVPTATPSPVPAAAPTYVGPSVLSTPEPSPTPVSTPTQTVPATPTTSEAPTDAVSWWLWFLGGIVVASGVAFLIGRRTRDDRTTDLQEDVAVPIAPEPATPPRPARPPVAPVAPVVPPAPVPPVAPVTPVVPLAPTPGPFLEFQLAPLRVGMEGDRALLDFDLTVGNPASTPVAQVRIATMLLTANAAQDEQLAAFFASEGGRGLDPFALGGGERRHLEATMTLPRAAVNVVTANDRSFFVPMIAIDARYRWEDGRESRTTAAFMVGPAAPQGKLAPIFVDRGDRMVDRLDVRLHGQVRRT